MWRILRSAFVNLNGQSSCSSSQYRLVSATYSTNDNNDDASLGNNDPELTSTNSSKDQFQFGNSQIKDAISNLRKTKIYRKDHVHGASHSSTDKVIDEAKKVIENEDLQNTFKTSKNDSGDDQLSLTALRFKNDKVSSKQLQKISSEKDLDSSVRSIESIEKDADLFGSLQPSKNDDCEDYVGDDAERKQEAYDRAVSEHRYPTTYYSHQMKLLCSEGKLREALAVLEEEMPAVNAKPDHYCYRVLIRACARQGYSKKAFSLFNKMKKRAIIPQPLIYTHLFVACGNSPFLDDGLARAKKLRQLMQEKQILINEVLYHAMIRAFGRCGDLETSFELLDEMISKSIKLSTESYNFLLQACISDKHAGFRHAIMIWRRMRSMKILPDIYSYNLLLRCIKECGAGDQGLLTQMLQGIVAPLVPKRNQQPHPELKQEKFQDRHDDNKFSEPTYEICITTDPNTGNVTVEKKTIAPKPKVLPPPSSEVVKLDKEHDALMAPVSDTLILPTLLAERASLGSVVDLTSLDSSQDRLALVGGSVGLLTQMQTDAVRPNIKTFTQLLVTLPKTAEAEEALLQSMEAADVAIDITFCNMLIKRRNFRGDTEQAKDVLELVSSNHLQPNVITYGCLATGCRSMDEAKQLLADIKNNGFVPNNEIMSILATIGVKRGRYVYALDMLCEMGRQGLTPDEKLITALEEGRQRAYQTLRELNNKTELLTSVERHHMSSCRLFLTDYRNWLKRTSFKPKEHPWAHYEEPRQPSNAAASSSSSRSSVARKTY